MVELGNVTRFQKIHWLDNKLCQDNANSSTPTQPPEVAARRAGKVQILTTDIKTKKKIHDMVS